MIKKMLDRKKSLWYSEECYIMARYAYLSLDRRARVIINLKKKQG